MRNYKILLNTIEVKNDKHFSDLYQVFVDMIEDDGATCKYYRPVFAENEQAAIAKVFFELENDEEETYFLAEYNKSNFTLEG